MEGEKDPSPEAVQGFANIAEPTQVIPTEGPEGGEELGVAGSALQVDPLLDTQEVPKTGPEYTREGPAAVEVTEGAQEGPPKEQLPQVPHPSIGDKGLELCVTKEGMEETPPGAGVGSADKVEPMQATPTEGQEGGEEPERAREDSAFEVEPLPVEQMDPETSPQPTTEGSEGGEEPESAQGSTVGGDPSPWNKRTRKPVPSPPLRGRFQPGSLRGSRRSPRNSNCLRLPPLAATRVLALVLSLRGKRQHRLRQSQAPQDGPESVPQS
ncbi:UNVERIFIED_CONTAM: hypothetical protein FKN15_052964 [Acipenser sinensis]